MEQLSPRATATEAHEVQLENPCTTMKDPKDATKIPCAQTKTRCSQINKYFLKTKNKQAKKEINQEQSKGLIST